ncbi:MAG: YcaO-like family protein [Candidatus Rokubacteria bacterium]|nr:YcaO-like family protein [Candidatus Rokubacteria bacterium]
MLATYLVVPPGLDCSRDALIDRLSADGIDGPVHVCRELGERVDAPDSDRDAPSGAPAERHVDESSAAPAESLVPALDRGWLSRGRRLVVRLTWPPTSDVDTALLRARLACPDVRVAVSVRRAIADDIFQYLDRLGLAWIALAEPDGADDVVARLCELWCRDRRTTTAMEPAVSVFRLALAAHLRPAPARWRCRIVDAATWQATEPVSWSPSLHAAVIAAPTVATTRDAARLDALDERWTRELVAVARRLDLARLTRLAQHATARTPTPVAAPRLSRPDDVEARVRHIAASGFDIRWTRTLAASDEPDIHAVSVTIAPSVRGSGLDAFSAELALARGVGEAIERWAWQHAPCVAERLRIASPASLGAETFALEALAGYSPALRARQHARLAWTSRTPFAWTEGVALTSAARRWVPLQLVSRAAKAITGVEPELRPPVTTGFAAHPDRRVALLNALLEVVERDAFMLTWLARGPARPLDVEHAGDARLRNLVSRFASAGLVPCAVALATDVPIPVVLAMLRDERGDRPAFAVGAAARASTADATIAALIEAFACWRYVRRLSTMRRAPTEPTDLDRDGRLLWWAQPDRWRELAWLLDGPCVAIEAEAAEDTGATLDRLVGWFRSAGEEAVVVDLLDEPLTRRVGHHVVAAVAPGFHPMHLDETRPARWSRRLSSVPRALGRSSPPALNALPHPFP